MGCLLTIKEKGLLKKKLNLSSIIDKNLGVCEYDANFRMIDEIANADFVYVYDPQKLGRPINLCIYKGKVEINYNYPVTLSDLKLSYKLVKNVCALYNTNEFYKEKEIKNIQDIDSIVEEELKFNEEAFTLMEENNTRSITLVLNPFILKKRDIEKFKKDNKVFEDYLHELQEPGYYYASPIVYKEQKLIYTVTQDVLSVVPLVPENEKSFVALPDLKDNELVDIFYINYNDFINNVKKDKEYDEEHVIVLVDQKEREKLSKYKVDI